MLRLCLTCVILIVLHYQCHSPNNTAVTPPFLQYFSHFRQHAAWTLWLHMNPFFAAADWFGWCKLSEKTVFVQSRWLKASAGIHFSSAAVTRLGDGQTHVAHTLKWELKAFVQVEGFHIHKLKTASTSSLHVYPSHPPFAALCLIFSISFIFQISKPSCSQLILQIKPDPALMWWRTYHFPVQHQAPFEVKSWVYLFIF